MTISGLVVKEIHLSSNESQFTWDGENEVGERVGTAVYIVSASHPSQPNLVSKIAVISK
jgi:flagellar hook assembly protein FlgD